MSKIETDVRDKIIEAGLKSVAKEDKKEAREGGKEGFELCRKFVKQEDYVNELEKRSKKERTMQSSYMAPDSNINSKQKRPPTLENYWRYRWATLQIEWVYKVMQYVWGGEFMGSARAGLMFSRILRENPHLESKLFPR